MKKAALVVLAGLSFVWAFLSQICNSLLVPTRAQITFQKQFTPAVQVPESFFNDLPLKFTHIPKNSGISIIKELNLTVQDGPQMCYKANHDPQRFNMVFLRAPFSQIHSAFLFCSHAGNKWVKRKTRQARFPRTGNDKADFDTWLAHFASLTYADAGGQVGYGCIDPRDIQTRYMECQSAKEYRSDFAFHRAPNYTLALENVNKVDFLGITDFYHESLCLLWLRRTRILPTTCSCGAPSSTTLQQQQHVHHTHGVRPHSDNFEEPTRTWAANITRLDRALYLHGLQRFAHEIDLAEQIAGRTFLCNKTRIDHLQRYYYDSLVAEASLF